MKQYKREGRLPFHHCRKAVVLLVLACLLCISSVGGTLARYATKQAASGVIKSRNFFFTSNYLRPQEEKASYTVYSDSVEILLENNDGLNISDTDIAYGIWKDGTEEKKGTFPGGAKQKILWKINGEFGTTVTVTAKAKSPYTQELTASFRFENRDGGSYYQVTDKGYAVYLDIWTGQTAPETVTVSFSGLSPDTGVGLTADWKNETPGTFSPDPNAHYTLIFFDEENTNKDYSRTKTVLDGNTITLSGTNG